MAQYWFLRDVVEKKRSDDLALEDRETAARVAVQSLDYYRQKWPGVKVWYMHPPMADEDDYLAKTTGTSYRGFLIPQQAGADA